jgi:hypothetical protein
MKAKDHQRNLKFDSCPRLRNGTHFETPRDRSGGLSEEGWRRVKAALEFAREYDRTRKLLIETKPLSEKVQ